jgi:hypothetical protein
VIWHHYGDVARFFIMRMNLRARAVRSRDSDLSKSRITLTIRPACSLPGDYSYTTNSDSLLRMLRKTDLPSTVLDNFRNRIYGPKGASLLAVEISETTLTEIGYFVD